MSDINIVIGAPQNISVVIKNETEFVVKTNEQGPQGLQGNPLGKWKGAYNGAIAYVLYDITEYHGSSYIAKGDTTGNLPTNVTFWELLVSKGDQGAQGAQGIQGIQGETGATGAQGAQGAQGVAGETGPQGAQGIPGNDGATGPTGPTGATGATGPAGSTGPQGTPGTNGTNGIDGTDGVDGSDGLSAYQVAVNNGFVGDQTAWLASLVGPEGPQGIPGEGLSEDLVIALSVAL